MSIESVPAWFVQVIQQAKNREIVGECAESGRQITATYYGAGRQLSGAIQELVQRMEPGPDRDEFCRGMIDVIGSDPKNPRHVLDAMVWLRRWLPGHLRRVIRARRRQFAQGFISNGAAYQALVGIAGPRDGVV